jgi:uncharacterized peroxidase-related enzyme
MTFPVHTLESAPAASKTTLAGVQKSLGFVPNLLGVFAGAPAALEAYTRLGAIFDTTSFDPTERQVILLTTSFENECGYCMAAHSTLAAMQRVPVDVIEALRTGEPLPDPRLEALAVFTRKVVQEAGWVSPADVRSFLEAGFSRPQVLELLVGVAMKTLSNYTNHISETPVDEAFQPQAWKPQVPAS